MRQQLKFLAMLAGISVVALVASLWILWSARSATPGETNSATEPLIVLPQPRALTDFTLWRNGSRVFDLGSLRDRWTFVFFGFTSCPDVCPTTLVSLARLQKQIIDLGVAPEELQFTFVSVDPQRDSPEEIERYVTFFEPRFVGVTGSEAQLTNLSRQLGAAFKVEYAPGAENYPVYHTGAVFLVDPSARLHAILRSLSDPAGAARRFREVRGGFVEDSPRITANPGR